MDMYKSKFTRLQNEIFRLLCIKAGESLNQRTISRILKVSPTAIANSIINLAKEKFIKIKKDERINLNLIELNRENEITIKLKRIENLRLIYESELVKFLDTTFPGSSIILFGSYAFGEDTTKSDIDIAIIGNKEKGINIKNFENLLERPIRINFYPNFKSIHKHLKENICNGIILKGGVEL